MHRTILVDHVYFDRPDVWLFSKAMPWVSYNCRTYWPSAAEYHAGELPPHYPMPAKYDDYSNPNVWDCVLGYYICFG